MWQEMIDNLIHFTETSTSLMIGMQKKLGIPPDADPNVKMCDPCGLLEKLKDELGGMELEEKPSPVCTCTSPSQTLDDDDTNPDITAGIECYKPPRVIRKKKFKYSSEIESQLLAKKKRNPPCTCNKESCKLPVDACLCKKLPEEIQLRDTCDDIFCPITLCSDLTQEEIVNIYCEGEIPEKPDSNIDQDPLAWIRKPGSFDPDKLPQDDEHPYVIKTEDNFRMRNNSLGYELFNAMMRYSNNIAQIDYASKEMETYSDYARRCILVAKKLKRETSKEDLIGLCTSNHKNTYIPYLAGLFNGNRVVAFDRSSDRKEMQNCLVNVTPKIMFVGEDSLTFLQECMQSAKVDFKIVVFGGENDAGFACFESYLHDDGSSLDDFQPDNTEDLDSTCLICFTGGIPEAKTVCLSHYGLLRQSFRMITTEHAQPVILSFLENYQISSLLVLFSSILTGVTRIIVEEFEEENTWKLVEKYEINALHLYPHHCVKLSTLPEPEEDTSSLFYIFLTGGNVSSGPLNELKRYLMKTLICHSYEHTEMSGIIALFDFSKPEDNFFNYFINQSVGRPINGVWYKVIDLKTGRMVHQYETGELFVKSRQIRNGYFVKNQEQPQNKEGWISTGDLVFFDTYKCFHYVDKIRDLIKYKDIQIVPSKIENVLLSHPMVTGAVVIPVSNEVDGQHIAAVVTVRENEDIYAKDLEDWIKTRVPEEEQLRGGVRIVGSLPSKSNGRINRKVVRMMET